MFLYSLQTLFIVLVDFGVVYDFQCESLYNIFIQKDIASKDLIIGISPSNFNPVTNQIPDLHVKHIYRDFSKSC